MASPLGDPSREATPSSTSSQGMSNDFQSSYSASASSSQGPQPPEDVDRFLKRMDMEKKLQALQQRLELASVKATNGWTDMSIGEIEDKLPIPPARRRSFQPVPSINLEAVASSSRTRYEPPSPARPWQLMDVLWQPLPPPSRGPMSPGSPVSPSVQRRRSKRDEIRFEEGVGALSNGVGGGPALPGGHHLPVHRRASSAAMMAYLSNDPYPVHSGGRIRKEKRSQSHSHTTTQDVDAAKALTAMLGGGGNSNGNHTTPFMPGTPPRHRSTSAQRRAPSTAPPRPSRRSESTTREYDAADRLRVDASAANRHEDEDTDAAELMMFLAHSPSAAGTRRYSPSSDSASSSYMGGAARVLFADGPHDPPKQQPPAVGSSNLALAPPITAGSLLSGSDD